jgi:ribosome-associated toxin RatA of RatAB toxin-antitoxin module
MAIRRGARPVKPPRAPFNLGPMPTGRRMVTFDVLECDAPMAVAFDVVRDVERWPTHLPHYRWVKLVERAADGGGVVEMSANRPFGALNWPTFWRSEMSVHPETHSVRFRHTGGVTTGMDVEWRLEPLDGGSRTKLVLEHVWDGPWWPAIGPLAATQIIGPVFVHGIATRTMDGLARVAAMRVARAK